MSNIYRNLIRPVSPKLFGKYNRINVCQHPIEDLFLTCEDANRPDYEKELIQGLEAVVQENDHVCVIGGGYGVSSVKAHLAGASKITVYEPAKERIKDIRKLLKKYGCDNFEVCRAIFYSSPDELVRGSLKGCDSVKSSVIPECDVLEIDCEGCEQKVLENLEVRPRHIVVETHEHLGCPKEDVAKLLDKMGYQILFSFKEDKSNNIDILVAEFEGGKQ